VVVVLVVDVVHVVVADVRALQGLVARKVTLSAPKDTGIGIFVCLHGLASAADWVVTDSDHGGRDCLARHGVTNVVDIVSCFNGATNEVLAGRAVLLAAYAVLAAWAVRVANAELATNGEVFLVLDVVLATNQLHEGSKLLQVPDGSELLHDGLLSFK